MVACSNPSYQVGVGTEVVAVDPKYFRHTEVDLLIGDPTKSKTKLGWEPKYDLDGLVTEMVAADIELFEKEKLLKSSGCQIAIHLKIIEFCYIHCFETRISLIGYYSLSAIEKQRKQFTFREFQFYIY